jgi:DNA-binding beta-propeller fold protein YncE
MLTNKLWPAALALVAMAFLMAGGLFVPTQAAPLPVKKEKPAGVIVLDDCDPQFKGKAVYEDGLSFLSASGKLQKRVTGLNNCQEIGNPHRIAIDHTRKRVWVAELVGRRLLLYTLDGKEVLNVPDAKPGAVAVDPATGNAWVVVNTGEIAKGHIAVYGPTGHRLAKYDIPAYDIVYDPKSKAIWALEKQLVKLSLDGKVLLRQDVADWCAVSLAVNPKSGDVWAVTRRYLKKEGKNALLCFDGDGKPLHTIGLEDQMPSQVVFDSRDGSVWVVIFHRGLLHYDAKGKLIARHKLAVHSVAVNPANDNIWAVTDTEIQQLSPKGKTLNRTPLKGKTTAAWIACY